jgi:DNA polymerase
MPTSAADFIPADATLPVLREAARNCRGCDLYKHATQTIFGEGNETALILFIGEQPGNEEDHQGRPFVGPAGRLLNRALEEAGIERTSVYITNAVKHFKFEQRGKRRLNKKPGVKEVRACHWWLEAEISVVHAKILVCLGATAAQSVFGPGYRLTEERGRIVKHPWGPFATSMIHPSGILRMPDQQKRHIEYQQFVEDLRNVLAFVKVGAIHQRR